jgi:WD40 repeat protein
LVGHQGSVLAFAFSPDDKTLASGGMDGTLRLWHVGSGSEMLIFTEHQGAVTHVAFRRDGRSLAYAVQDPARPSQSWIYVRDCGQALVNPPG